MEFRILGPFEAVGTTGVLDVRGAKRRGLLACLLVHAGQPLRTDRLVEELWGDAGSDGAARTVQTYVSQLRRLLEGEAARLVTGPSGYVLEVAAGDVDASRFERALAAAGTEPDAARRLAGLDGALALWRGPPLREFAGTGWADQEASRLEALHVRAVQRRYDALLELGRAGDAAVELEHTVRAYPLDERFTAQLMLALYRCGRQADALGAYQQTRRHLVDELGIEPGPELVELEHRILDHDPTLGHAADRAAAGDEHDVPAPRPADRWHARTFLLTDVVDSVALWERDAAAMAQAVEWHESVILDAVTAAGGELVRSKGEGDSTFSVFARPADALATAAEIHEAVTTDAWPSLALRVRVGVHTGEAESRDGDWYGPAVNRAARLRALGDGGQTLVSGVTAGLAADQIPKSVRLLYLGRRVLRGIERPEEVWELVPAEDPRTDDPMSARVGDLPVARTSFVGRADDVDHLADLMRAGQVVTLTGPGGSGKSRLALEVARRARRQGVRVWLAELAPVRDPGSVAQVVATAIGLETGPDPLDDLVAYADTLAGVLLLDNCEHLVDACAALTERLLAAATDIRVLATSREPLRVTGEREWPVGSLGMPDTTVRDPQALARFESVQLLIDRARAVRPDVEIGHDDVASVVRICRALDGVPLAIELAAGRLRSLDFAELQARLGDQLAVLARPGRTGRDDARHRSVRRTIDWSYDLLTEEQRTVAQRLSVFAGGFRLDAAEAVCGGDLDVLDGVDELVAKSLLSFDATTARYRLLEPIRQYLAERLAASGNTAVAQRAHAEWTAELCWRVGIGLLLDPRTRGSRLRAETANVDVALQWALENREHDIALRIVGALGQYWFFNDNGAGRRWCAAVLEASVGASPRRRATALLSAGMVAQNDQAWDQSLDWLRQALAIYRAGGRAGGQAAALVWCGRALPDTTEAKRCLGESLELSTGLGDSVGAGICRVFLSAVAARDGDFDGAVELAEQVVDECGVSGVRYPVGLALVLLAYIAHRRGRHDVAHGFLRDAVAHGRELDDRRYLAGELVDLAAQEATMGRGAEALQTLAESSRIDEQIGRLAGRSYRLLVAALAHLERGDRVLATRALGGYDAHPSKFVIAGFGRLSVSEQAGWLDEAAVAAMRARLDPDAVAEAAAAARARPVEQLIDELIIQPAEDIT